MKPAILAVLNDATTTSYSIVSIDIVLCASAAEDMARIEDRTFTFSQEQSDAGPTNKWIDSLDISAPSTMGP